MKKTLRLIKKEPVLAAAAALALVSMAFVRPDAQYASYIDFSVLAILFSLMAVVAGFMELGLFGFISANLIVRSKSVKPLSILLVNCVFLSSMFITNDVALIAFVPITIGIFGLAGRDKLIFVVVMETVAANMGSMLTPIGNPQNLYLYSYYHLHILDFLKIVLPAGLIGYAVITGILLFSRNGNIDVKLEQKADISKIKPMLIFYGGLFLLCVLTVLHIIDYRLCFAAVLAGLLIVNRKLLKKVDYGLLLTFVAFFVFAGNIERIGAIKSALSLFINGRAFMAGVLSSQAVSNVPAAMMLSRFTGDARGLLLGVNVGGLGTPVASLASLISLKLYSRSAGSAPGRFLKVFSLFNFAILAFLAGAVLLFLHVFRLN